MDKPRVSAIPGIYAKDMSGFEDWICGKLHGPKPSHCCTKAKRDFYADAADLGTDVHALREAFLKGETFDYVPEYQARLFDPIATFYKESKYKPQFVEHQMEGEKFRGCLDGAGTFDVPFWEEQRKTFWSFPYNDGPELKIRPTVNDIWIEDLKVKSKLDILHPIQLFGYAELLKETEGIEAKWGLIIRRNKDLDKRPELQLKGYYLPAYRDMWEASLKAWGFLNQ